jgi:hypothetical protein
MASCFISARRHPLTSLRYSAADKGKGKAKTQNLKPFEGWATSRPPITIMVFLALDSFGQN